MIEVQLLSVKGYLKKRIFQGLQLMRQTESGLVIPNPISFNKQGILMEYIEFGKSSERQFGVCLAKMHLHNRNSPNQGNISKSWNISKIFSLVFWL